MNDRLTEVSESAATLIREGIQEAHKYVRQAQDGLDGIRKVPIVANGTKEALKTLSGKLEEVEKLFHGVLLQVSRTYGDPVGELEVAPAPELLVTEDSDGEGAVDT